MDEDPYNPREDDNIGKLCIREHRNYKFPNELKFDFDDGYEDDDTVENRIKELEKSYYIIWLDCYEHWGVVFSIHWEWMMCQFDTSQSCGFIAVPIAYCWYDIKEWNSSDCKDKWERVEVKTDEAYKIAKQELKDWNAYCNGEMYRYVVENKVKWTSEDWREEDEREFEDGCGGYYELDDILFEFEKYNPVEID